MKRLHKFLRLRACDRQLLVAAFVLLAAIRLGLWLLRFSTLYRLLLPLMRVKVQLRGELLVSVTQVVWAISVASRSMPGQVKCLALALTAQVLLCRWGHAANLRIGVAKGMGGQLEAHAWVESQGRVAIGGLSNLSQFTPLSSMGGICL
jgi:hypothetical protein